MNAADAPAGFAELLALHRRWLGRHGLLDRPWFILGSAPDPTLPAAMPADAVHVHVKYAGRSAAALGLPPGDVTLLLHKTEPSDLDGVTLKNVLRLGRRAPVRSRLKRLAPFVTFREQDLTNRERDAFFLAVVGSLFEGVGREERPSNGLAMICYALAVGAPQAIVAGLSLEAHGYAYDTSARPRRHQPEDRAALAEIAARYGRRVVTTEPALARASGLPLFEG